MSDTTNESPTLGALAAALAKAQGAIKNADKNSLNANPHVNKKYADLGSVWDACRGPLAENGLSVVQRLTTDGEEVTLTSMLLHASGEFIRDSVTARVQPIGSQPWVQALGISITYLRRYSLSALVGVAPAGDDTDGEGATAEAAEPRRPRAQTGGPTTFPNFGKAKGEAISDAAVEHLEWYLGRARESLADPEKAKWHAKESALIGAYEAELARQRQKAAPAPPPGDKPLSDPPPSTKKPPLVVGVREGETEAQAKSRAIYETAVELIGRANSIAQVDKIITSAKGKVDEHQSAELGERGWRRKKELQGPTFAGPVRGEEQIAGDGPPNDEYPHGGTEPGSDG